MRVFMEKLKRAGACEGFLDPAAEDLGFLWVEEAWDGRGSPLSTRFYMRKGGSRKISASKRRKMSELLTEVGGAIQVAVEAIEKEAVEDPLPLHRAGASNVRREYPCTVRLEHRGLQQDVALCKFYYGSYTYYEVGQRRQQKRGQGQECPQVLSLDTATPDNTPCSQVVSMSPSVRLRAPAACALCSSPVCGACQRHHSLTEESLARAATMWGVWISQAKWCASMRPLSLPPRSRSH